MIKNKCFVCGSFNFRADRALSGRLVCISCGNPYGVRKLDRDKSTNHNFLFIKKNKFFILLFIIVVFIIFI